MRQRSRTHPHLATKHRKVPTLGGALTNGAPTGGDLTHSENVRVRRVVLPQAGVDCLLW